MIIVHEIYQKLSHAGYHSPQLWSISCWIAGFITKLSYAHIIQSKRGLLEKEQQQLEQIIRDLTVHNKPMAYVLGTIPFCSLELEIIAPILIPRPETEEWVLQFITRLSQQKTYTPKNILDIGTGSGCIALALAHTYPSAQVVATDISEQALKLACHNQKKLSISNVFFIKTDLFPPTQKNFDIIVSNPPYISEDVWQTLDPSVRTWEDKRALVAADHGRALIKRIIQEARRYLVHGGILAIEIGYDQADLYTFMQSCGYTDVQVWHDGTQQSRVLMGSHEVAQN